MIKSNECLFIPNEVMDELEKEGLTVEKGAPAFSLSDTEGVLVSEDIIAEFVKETGIRIEKATTDYDGIYQFLGYLVTPKGCTEETKEGCACSKAAVAGENPKPCVQVFAEPSEGLKTKLNIAIAALQDVVTELK